MNALCGQAPIAIAINSHSHSQTQISYDYDVVVVVASLLRKLSVCAVLMSFYMLSLPSTIGH